MIKKSKQSFIKESILVTNGRRLAKSDYLKSLSDAGLDVFSITIYSSQEDVHDKITKTKSWYQTSTGIKNAIKLDKKVTLNVVVGPDNYSTTIESVKEFVDWGVDRVIVSCSLPFIGADGFVGDASLSPKKFAELARALTDAPSNVFVLFELPLCLLEKDVIKKLSEDMRLDYGCHIGVGSGIVVDVNGNVLPCNSFANFPLFNIFEFDAINKNRDEFYQFWNQNKEVVNFRAEANVLRSPICQKCSLWQICNCGCPLLWGYYNPDDYISDNLIDINIKTINSWIKNKQQ